MALDRGQLVGGHRVEIFIEARLRPVLGDVLHRRVRQVADECQIPVPLGHGFFIHTQPPRHPGPLRELAPGDRAFQQVPRLVPTDSQNPGGPADVAFLQHVDRQAFKQQGEARVGLRPRQAHLPDAVVGAVHPGGPRVQVGHELAGIEMPPRPFRRVVVDRQLRPARRAGPAHAVGVPGPHIHPLFRHRQVDSRDRPRRLQPEDTAVQFDIAHGSQPPREPSCRTAPALWKLSAPWTHRPRPPRLGKRSAFSTSFHRALPSPDHPRKTRKNRFSATTTFLSKRCPRPSTAEPGARRRGLRRVKRRLDASPGSRREDHEIWPPCGAECSRWWSSAVRQTATPCPTKPKSR